MSLIVEEYRRMLEECAKAGDGLEHENKKLRARVAKLEAALNPFAHEDLAEILGGNCEGGESIVFQRNKATLRIRHFVEAKAALEDLLQWHPASEPPGNGRQVLCAKRTNGIPEYWFDSHIPLHGGWLQRERYDFVWRDLPPMPERSET